MDADVEPAVAGADPAQIIAAAVRRGLQLATAESLTGGLLVSRLVDVPGASRAVAGGAVCYSYAAKTRLLGVPSDLLERDGAVSGRVAELMAQGALHLYGADLAVSTTGVAGPGPDDRGVPAGRVHLGLATADGAQSCDVHLAGDRAVVRVQAVAVALDLLADYLL